MQRIYLDNNATTPLAQEVLDVMAKALSEGPANPSSIHWFGRSAKAKLSLARDQVADFFGVRPREVLFTSGGTEALNLLLRGIVAASPKGKIITSNVEHSAVEATLAFFETQEWTIERLPVGLYGNVQTQQIQEVLDEATRCIVISAVNSETGVKAPIDEIADLAEKRNIPLIVDGVAWLGKESIRLHPGISGIAFSAHKIHGPKGVGLAIVRSSLKIPPLLTGGFQEFGKRGGTENLEGILGFAKALELLKSALPDATIQMTMLRDHLETALIYCCGAQINGEGPRICNISNLYFPNIDAETLLIQLDMAGIAASQGSACNSGALEPSRVLLNMGFSLARARSSVRFSLNRYTTQSEIDTVIEFLSSLVPALTF